MSGFRKIKVNGSGFSSVYQFCEGGTPPPPISPQSIQSKLVNSKVFKNKDLPMRHVDFGAILEKILLRDSLPQRRFFKELKLVWAGLRAVSGDGRTSGLFDPIVIIARGGREVCDRAHRRFVMKKGAGIRCDLARIAECYYNCNNIRGAPWLNSRSASLATRWA